MPRYRVYWRGIKDVKDALGEAAGNKLKRRVGTDIEEGVDRMAERSYERAPVETSALANSILASVHKEAPLTYVYGSHMAYAQRQEYEHRTRRGYFRKAIRKEMPFIQDKLVYTVRTTLR